MKDAIVIAPLIAASVYLRPVFGDGMDPGVGSMLGSIFSNLGVMGVLGWYLWYDKKVAGPKAMKEFREEAKAERLSNAAEREAERLSNATEQREMRATFERVTDKLTNMVIQTLAAVRTAVHDVKDTAQTAITEAARIETRKNGDSKQGT